MKQPIEFEIPVKEFEFSKLPWKIFIMTFIGMFIMVSLQYMGVHFPKIQFNVSHLLDPLSPKTSVMDDITPKLEQKTNTYQLKKQTGFIPQAFAAETADYDGAKAYAVLDYDSGTILSDKNGDEEVPIASLTKIMSAIVLLDLMSPDEQVTVTSDVPNIVPTRIGANPGEKLTVKEILEAMLMTSANDAAQVAKDGVDNKYGEQVFINAMNQKAQYLGLTHTHFANPQGFDNPENYSSADDLAVLTHYALTNYPLIAQIVQQDKTTIGPNANHHEFDLLNWNGLLGVYPNVFGVKIGNTTDAGTTMIVGSSRAGKNILVVLLGAPGILQRDEWAAELLDNAYQQTLGLSPVDITQDQLEAKYQSWYD